MQFLSGNKSQIVMALGEVVNGVPREELGNRFLKEADSFIMNLDDFLRKDLGTLLHLFNSRIMVLLLTGKFKNFTSMDMEEGGRYISKWSGSRIPLFRTAAKTLAAVAGWSYYCNDSAWEEMNYPGKTIGREHLTPTLLYGKEPWRPENA